MIFGVLENNLLKEKGRIRDRWLYKKLDQTLDSDVSVREI